MYLQQAMGAVEYKQTDKNTTIFGYDPNIDTVLYNPKHPFFHEYDFNMVNTHELGHRIDHMFVKSWEQSGFMTAIRDAQALINANPDMFTKFCKRNDADGFLSDILDAISEGKYDFPMGHGIGYWTPENQATEIFTNLFGLQSCRDREKLEFLKEHFPALLQSFDALEFGV